MERVLEPELMDDTAQALAYARADFAEPNQAFVNEFLDRFGTDSLTTILDLGCGPADISARLAAALPAALVDALDGSAAMLECGRDLLSRWPEVAGRVNLIESMLPADPGALPRGRYDAIVSNSLLHHLHDPTVLWGTIAELGSTNTAVLVMDLFRPPSRTQAEAIVAQYAADEPAVLQEDFFNSLLAAFTPGEVVAQLRAARLPLQVQTISDRHLLVSGRLP